MLASLWVFLLVRHRFFSFLAISEIGEILCSQYSTQVVLVSSPERIIHRGIAGLEQGEICQGE